MTRNQYSLRIFLTTVLAAMLAVGVVVAQSEPAAPGSQPDTAFAEVIDVRVINLEVVVEDDGVRVHDLQPEDFQLLVDGREVPIEYFTEVVGGIATARQGASADATVPAQVPGEAVATSFLLFIDDYFSIGRDRDRVIDGLVQQLPNVRPNDRMAIVSFDGTRVDMLSNWTSSIPALTRALKAAKERPAGGLMRLAEQRTFSSRAELAAQGLNTDGLAGENGVTSFSNLSAEGEFYAQKIEGDVERATLAASAALRSFAQPPGRKVLLLLSGGWPSDPVRFVAPDPARAQPEIRRVRGGDVIGPLAETANRLGYTIYPVDVPGIESTDAGATVASLDAAVERRNLGTQREIENQSTLFRLAAETGGKALVNSLRDVAFERVVADIQSYYWIGFSPAWKGDDSVHDVKMKVRDRKLKIRTRENFSDLSRATEVNMMVESVLRFGDAPGGIPLTATVGRGKSAGWGKREVPLSVAIPLDALTFLPTSQGFEAKAELRVAVLDADGGSADIPVVPLELTSPRLPNAGEALPYETFLKMRNKRHDLVVSIYDNASGRILSAKLEVKEN